MSYYGRCISGSFAPRKNMSVIILLISASTLVAGVFLFAFIWAARTGQFDDDRSPAVRILNDDSPATPSPSKKQ
jgi:cbb3-type cytochrome oxidase maturation protein